jgi:toxin YoeB
MKPPRSPVCSRQAGLARRLHTKEAQKKARKLAGSGLKRKAEELLEVPRPNPRQMPPPYEELVGDLAGAYSRRINIQQRLVYQVLDSEHSVKVIRMWTR